MLPNNSALDEDIFRENCKDFGNPDVVYYSCIQC